MDWIPVVCPTCFESFDIPPPDLAETEAQLDYDCEICCRPMVLTVAIDEDGETTIQATSLDGTG